MRDEESSIALEDPPLAVAEEMDACVGEETQVTHAAKHRPPGRRLRGFKRRMTELGVGALALLGGAAKQEANATHLYPKDAPLVWSELKWIEQSAIDHEAALRHKYWDQKHEGDLNPPPVEEIKRDILKEIEQSPELLPELVAELRKYPFSQEWVGDMYGQSNDRSR